MPKDGHPKKTKDWNGLNMGIMIISKIKTQVWVHPWMIVTSPNLRNSDKTQERCQAEKILMNNSVYTTQTFIIQGDCLGRGITCDVNKVYCKQIIDIFCFDLRQYPIPTD